MLPVLMACHIRHNYLIFIIKKSLGEKKKAFKRILALVGVDDTCGLIPVCMLD